MESGRSEGEARGAAPAGVEEPDGSGFEIPGALTDIAMNLVFCLLAMTAVMRLADKAKEVKVSLPEVGGAAASAGAESVGVVVTITRSGDVLVGGERTTPEGAGEAAAVAGGVAVKIRVDQGAPSGRLVQVQAALARRKVRAVYVAVEEVRR